MFKVMFACIGNSARSQMAQGFAEHYGKRRIEARSGGSVPLGHVLPEAIEVMREVGIDISKNPSQGFDLPWTYNECNYVVTMGCGDDACPAFAGKEMTDWALPDPKGKSLAEFRKVRDDIERRVILLLRSKGIPIIPRK
jgi:protein-tyrosine-phosphatase